MRQNAADSLFAALSSTDLPQPVREYLFAKQELKRLWRFDIAFVDQRVAVEVDGGSWIGGRHTRGAGFEGDLEKFNAAAELGWSIYRFTTRQVKNGTAMETLKRVLGGTSDTIRDIRTDLLSDLTHVGATR